MFRRFVAILIAVLFTTTLFAGTVPTPHVSSIKPAAVRAGAGAFIMVVYGSNFTRNSVVRWNGIDQATAFFSHSELRIKVPASYLTTAGPVSITVYTYSTNHDSVVAESNRIVLHTS